MKLQRNNKYSRKITSGIATILLMSSVLCGCNKIETTNDISTNIVEEVKDENYYLNYYKITDEERLERLKELDIKYPNASHLGQYLKTLVVKDNDVYKILPVIELWDLNNNKSIFYDLFTEEKLFEYPFNDVKEITAEVNKEYGDYISGYDFNKIQNAIPYFKDKEIVEFGVCFYAETFLKKHLNEFSEKDGIEYKINMDDIIEYFYDIPFNPDNMLINTYDYADNYVTTVPVENQVTSKELGLESTYREEDKYSDYWKISKEEIEEKLNDFDIFNEEFQMNASKIQTLILKDSDNNYKVMNVCMDILNSKVLEVYDVYSGTHLFDLLLTGKMAYDKIDEEYVNIDLNNIYNAIPYFEDKEIVKIDNLLGTVHFVENNYNYFVNTDNINYKPLENSYYFYIHYNEEYSLGNIYMSKKDYAKYYIISVPEDLQVSTKDLGMKLEDLKVKVMLSTRQY